MALLNLLDVSLSFGGPAVLENINFQIDPGERVCLVGRNGVGKSTLMRVIVGEMQPDKGSISRPLMPGLQGKEKALRKEFERCLEGKVEQDLL
jgi:ATPase subunit of ABC transporter with duplicated ATPase domains